MPANKNAMTRYKILDELLSNQYHNYSLDELTEEVNNATKSKKYVIGINEVVNNLFYIFACQKMGVREIPYSLVERYIHLLREKSFSLICFPSPVNAPDNSQLPKCPITRIIFLYFTLSSSRSSGFSIVTLLQIFSCDAKIAHKASKIRSNIYR